MATHSAIDAPTIGRTRDLLRRFGSAQGTNQAYFERIVELLGSAPGEARNLIRKWKAFYELGDYPAYALRAKGVGERLDGKWAEAGESFLSASEEARGAHDRAVFALGAVDSFARAGDVDRAVSIGKRMVRSLSKLGETSQAARVHLNLGNALLFIDDYRGAADNYEKAVNGLEGTMFQRDRAAAQLGLSGSLLFSGEIGAAKNNAQIAISGFEELGDEHYADLARLNLAHCFNLQGRGDDAVHLLTEIAPRITDSTSDSARRHEFLGDAYLRLNLFEEALDAYSEALKMPAIKRMPVNTANCHFGKASALTALGETADAKRCFRRAAKLYKNIGNLSWAGAAMAAESELANERVGFAQSLEALNVLRKSRSAFLLAEACIRHCERFGESRILNEASRMIDQHGYEFMRWRVDALNARNAKGGKRLQHWRSMFSRLIEDRLAATNRTSRSAFLRDKQDALSGYLADLLSAKEPLVEEALDVVTKSRSVTLIDELISANPAGLPQEAREALEEFRTAIAEESVFGNRGSRRVLSSGQRINELSRKLFEAGSGALPTSLNSGTATICPDVTVFAQTTNGFYSLKGNRSHALGLSDSDVGSMVRKAEFELLSPMVGISDACAANAELTAMRRMLLSQTNEDPKFIVPDGPLWGVPWSAVAESEVIVIANPLFAHELSPKPPMRVAVWAHDPGDLPNVRAEVDSIKMRFPNCEVFSRRDEAIRSLEDGVDLLHVAAHASVRSDNPLYSHIEMEDGPLFGIEVARAAGRVSNVTLSACDTGRVSLRHRMEPDGLVRSFLTLGAESVIASLWPLDDEGARRLMDSYYKSVAKGEGIVDSLSAARSALRDWREHPYYWASMTIFGGYSRKDSP